MDVKIAFAGDRKIAVDILEFILGEGIQPLALFVPTARKASHDEELVSLCDHLEKSKIFRGKEFREERNIKKIEDLKLDYIISIHFPYIYPKSILNIPEHGVINLHPAYLPYNRGWHTPTWAIYENTPYGATLHFMEESVDSGDIIYQKRLEIKPDDTADTLYQRVLELEKTVFKEAWADLVKFKYEREPQKLQKGTKHVKSDIERIQEIDLDNKVKIDDFIRKLRALTTNKISEAAYFEKNGKRYRVQIKIEKED